MQKPESVGDPPLHLVVADSSATGSPEPGWFSSFAGLLWCEWYAHSKLLLFFLGAWVLGLWGLSLFGNPAWMLLFGAAFALVAGPVYGGCDTVEACEEFAFSLPPTRAERYLARLAVGGGALLLFTGIDLLALGLDLPQILAKLYVDSGLVRPWPNLKSGLLYGLVLAAPAAVFALSFVIASLTHSRALVLAAPFWAILATLAALRLAFWYEDLVWENLNGYFACPLLLGVAATILCAGYRGYQRKEIGHHSAPLTLPARWWLWMLVFLAGALLALTLAASLARHYPQLFSPAA
jgi:hypothetical protein